MLSVRRISKDDHCCPKQSGVYKSPDLNKLRKRADSFSGLCVFLCSFAPRRKTPFANVARPATERQLSWKTARIVSRGGHVVKTTRERWKLREMKHEGLLNEQVQSLILFFIIQNWPRWFSHSVWHTLTITQNLKHFTAPTRWFFTLVYIYVYLNIPRNLLPTATELFACRAHMRAALSFLIPVALLPVSWRRQEAEAVSRPSSISAISPASLVGARVRRGAILFTYSRISALAWSKKGRAVNAEM